MVKIAYCAGHGHNTAGKRSPNGEREWDFNNKVALAFVKEISKYEDVSLKRMDDPTGKTDVPLSTRTNGANAWGADIYISFHHNANTAKWGDWTGVQTHIYKTKPASSMKLAQLVQPELVKAYGLRDRGIIANDLHITREAKCTAILIEGGFMDSTIDIKKLRDDKVLANAGIGVAKAVAKFKGLKPKATTAPTPTPSKPSTPSSSYKKPAQAKGAYPIGAIGKVTIVADTLNVRNTYDTKGKALGAVNKGETYFAYKQANGWYLIATGQWISGGNGTYAKFEDKPKEVIYRIRKSWVDEKSQIGAYTNLDTAKALADKNNGYSVFDDKGKAVYTPKKSEPKVMYRVRKTWADEKGQIGAYTELINAKDLADKNAGYKVFDDKGKAVYTPPVKVEQKPTPTPAPKPTPTPPPVPAKPVEDHTGHNSIMGKSTVSADKMVAFVKATNPDAKNIEEIANQFLSVGEKYGVRGDIAFCQSIIETGWFKFDGGTAVTPEQHNYCGLGVVTKGVSGNAFSCIKDGVTAQIQHLYAYASKDAIPSGETLLDPRFQLVTRGVAPHWEDLNNRWAMSNKYGQDIMALFAKLEKFTIPVIEEPTQEIPEQEETQEVTDEQVSMIKKITDSFVNQLMKLFGKK